MAVRDLVIIGSGPAGLSAAIYARRALLDTLVLEGKAYGGQITLSTEVANYPGVPDADGFTLMDGMRWQAENLGAQIELRKASALKREDSGIFLISADEEDIEARAVIVATGSNPARAGFVGEEEFTGRGVSYCAVCDAMFYRNKLVFVCGGGNSAAEEALELSNFASEVVVCVRKDHMRAQAALIAALEEKQNIRISYNTEIVGVYGKDLVESIELKNNITGTIERRELGEGAFGVFVYVGMRPNTELLRGSVSLDNSGHAVTDAGMRTEVPGLFAAGDCRAKELRQIVTATADGAIAATSAASYLRTLT